MQDNLTATFIPTSPSSLEDADSLAYELECLLIRHKLFLKEEGVDRQVQNLKYWLESNRKNFSAAENLSETGSAWLSDLCDSLKLAVEERQRLESEGGLPATKEQVEQNEGLLKTIRRIERILHGNSVPLHH